MTIQEELKLKASLLPENPGVYRFLGADNKIIYVGKAKNLKKRVGSYFGRTSSGKTKVMVSKIREISHIVVDNESEALLLENNLIKQYQPRYNVLMKDDKTFPWICIKNEPFPRVFLTRNVINDGSSYWGPYASVVLARTLLELVKQLYPLRTCSYNLSDEKISSSRYRVCLEYHLGNCLGPCVGEQSAGEYQVSIDQVKEILKGNIHNVNRYLAGLMKRLAADLRFEDAQKVKEKLEILEKYRSRSTVVNAKIGDVDVIGFSEEGERVFVNYLRIVKGAVVQTHTMEFRRMIDDSLDDVITMAITEMRRRHNSAAREVIVAFSPDIQEDKVKYTVPRAGDKLQAS
ncbi:MAG: excinuclease ABC subunit UvrC [Bacteroidales bacterium]